MAGGRERQEKSSAAAIGTRIAAVELLDVEFGRRKSAARTSLSVFRTKVAFVGRVSTPFAQATPEAAQETWRQLYGAFHQSSP